MVELHFTPLKIKFVTLETVLTLFFLGLNMFLVSINISTFRFNPSKNFLQLLVPIKI